MELPSSVTTMKRGDTTFYVVGTAHVSQKSVDDVKATIDAVHPDVVCVELCKARYDALTKDSAFRDLDVFKVVREGKTLYLLGHLALASYQRRIGASLGVQPGAELGQHLGQRLGLLEVLDGLGGHAVAIGCFVVTAGD